jgi:hypothetical protein
MFYALRKIRGYNSTRKEIVTVSIAGNLKSKSKHAALLATGESIVRYVQRDPEKNFDTMMKRLAALNGIFGNHDQFKAMMIWIYENPGTKN